MGRFVKHEPVRLKLSNGDYIDIKKRLSHGEQEDMFARMSPYATPGEAMKMDRREVRTARVVAYLLGWSFTDENEKQQAVPVPYSPMLPEQERIDTLRALGTDDFNEIYRAIVNHENAMDAELDTLKKTTNGGGPTAETSPSRPASAGASSGSGT